MTGDSSTSKVHEVGSMWAVKVGDGERVEFTRPDGSTMTVVATNGEAAIVLDVPGDFAAGNRTITAVDAAKS